MNTDNLEKQRLVEQKKFDLSRLANDRNKLGQYATPPILAESLVRRAEEIWNHRKDAIRFLDPAVGTGSFFSALTRLIPNKILSASGIEIDVTVSKIAQEFWSASGLNVINSDFTTLEPGILGDRPNLIIANPPYVRHHHLSSEQKKRLMLKVESKLGYKVSGLMGLYAYFMLLSHDWLEDDGIGIWLIPSEFMEVNYGSILRDYLINKVELLEIHRFDPKDVQFDDALVSSAVVIFKKRSPKKNHMTIFSYGGDLVNPKCRKSIAVESLKDRKWNKSFFDLSDHTIEDKALFRLGDYFQIKRGIATGANELFILSRSRAKELEIPEKFLKPILPSSRKIHASQIEREDNGYPMIDEQLVLIDTKLSLEEIESECKPLFEYLKTAEDRGANKGYITGNRTPWYKQETRPPSLFLCSYMGRGSENSRPFRFLLNKSEALASNNYLLIYPGDVIKNLISENEGLIYKIFDFLQGLQVDDLIKQGRSYGGGLFKLEPKELANVPIDPLINQIGQEYKHFFDIPVNRPQTLFA